MNKRASLTTRAVAPTGYPDILGMITNGKLFNIDALQVAVAPRPGSVNAGKPLEAIIFLQNALDVDVDALTRVIVPDTDAAGNKGRFSTKQTGPLRIGLRAGEVGYVTIPIVSAHNAAPGANYALQVELLVEQKVRGGNRRRNANGGAPFVLDELPDDRQEKIKEMLGLNCSITVAGGKPGGNRVILSAPFEVLPPTISGLPQELKASYVSLWSAIDFPDEAELIEKTKALTAVIVPQLNHGNVFFPLLKATQAHFEAANFRLWAGEAVAIAKLLTLVLEVGVAKPDQSGNTVYPRWFLKLCRLLVRNPQAAHNQNQLVMELLYPELVADATEFGFAMLGTVTKEKFGSADEIKGYAHLVSSTLSGKDKTIDFTHVYLPLVLAGIVANNRVTMPQEQLRETINLVATAIEKRANMRTDDTKFIFDLGDDLVERALEQA